MTEREWTGRLWTGRETTDGRRIAAGALTVDAVVDLPEPVPLLDFPVGAPDPIGKVTAIGELDGVGVGVGRTLLPAGQYAVAIEMAEAEWHIEESVQVVTEGRLRSVYLTATPVWPDAVITVHPSEEDR